MSVVVRGDPARRLGPHALSNPATLVVTTTRTTTDGIWLPWTVRNLLPPVGLPALATTMALRSRSCGFSSWRQVRMAAGPCRISTDNGGVSLVELVLEERR